MARKRINLALQGGGAHGAFTWGVLDRLLEEPELDIAGISGTSAGAMNGAALKAGLDRGGAEEARAALNELWARIGAMPDLGLPGWAGGWMASGLGDVGAISKALEASPVYNWTEAVSRAVSPYAYGPFYSHPLRRVVETFDYGNVCSHGDPDLFISATNVRTGKIRVFTREEITTEAILASGCLPTLFQAVEFTDPATGRQEAFWDGGYTGNPALFPLFAAHLPKDIVVININPLHRDEVPRRPQDIQNRLNEISFNSSLLRELRAINFVQRLIGEGRIGADQMKAPRIHMIADDGLMTRLSVATKIIPVPKVLETLREAGRAAAERFIEAHWDDLNTRQTQDLAEMFG
ncbi:patatin-like phospholipase family protein [Pseudaestuariivita atlantica]|uniref:Patatin n=1 Tax=Pseudaestuariivita atlantica TaxID=1317121 RepID=A0A0L1JNJ8_9RHOB|nr:patatin-like phospholipase family protein [Pseudaestuariivita atlantica]KNG92953.1 patatin [Pseudaestuariivita atlantica]